MSEGDFGLRRIIKGLGNLARRKDPPLSPALPSTSKEDPSSQEMHRQRVGEMARSLFMNFDAQVASIIGFDGNILETLHERRPTHHNDGINIQGMDPALRQFVDGARFFFRITDPETGGPAVMYDIDCYDGGFRPRIHLATNNGGSVEFRVLTGPDGKDFHRAHVTRHSRDENGNFSGARTVGTFTDSPLSIEQRVKSQNHTTIHYSNIDSDGNVTIPDGQSVFILPSSNIYDAGKYSAVEKTIHWDERAPQGKPSVTTDPEGATITLKRSGDTFTFPIVTNIYDELRNITAHVKPIPQLPKPNL